MLRSILSVVIGYVVMFAVVMISMAVFFIAPHLAMPANALEVTTGWLAFNIILSLLAAFLGGVVCRKIAHSMSPVCVLAGLALVLGMIMALQNAQRERPVKSVEEITAMAPMDKASVGVQPTAYSYALPLLAAVGILAGGMFARPKGERMP